MIIHGNFLSFDVKVENNYAIYIYIHIYLYIYLIDDPVYTVSVPFHHVVPIPINSR